MRARGKEKALQEHDEAMRLKENWREGWSERRVKRSVNKKPRKKMKKI